MFSHRNLIIKKKMSGLRFSEERRYIFSITSSKTKKNYKL